MHINVFLHVSICIFTGNVFSFLSSLRQCTFTIFIPSSCLSLYTNVVLHVSVCISTGNAFSGSLRQWILSFDDFESCIYLCIFTPVRYHQLTERNQGNVTQLIWRCVLFRIIIIYKWTSTYMLFVNRCWCRFTRSGVFWSVITTSQSMAFENIAGLVFPAPSPIKRSIHTMSQALT